MNREQQVVSLELAKKLNELGVKQESLFYWVRHWVPAIERRAFDLFYGKDENDKVNEYISAFTVAELGEMLGTHYHSYKVKDYFEWVCDAPNNKAESQYANTEADARAKMLIYLLENKLIAHPEVEQEKE